MTYQDALDRAFDLSGDRDALEAFLRTVPEWRASLEGALIVSQDLSRDLRAILPRENASQQAQRQLMSTVSRLAAQPASPGLFARLATLLTLPRLGLVGVITLVIAIAVVAGLPGPDGGGTQTAEAVIEGSVAEVGPGAVTISTKDTSQVVRLSSNTILTDGFGNALQASDLNAGQDVVLKGSHSGDEFVASAVELRDRLFGVVTAMPGDSLHLSSSKGDFVILITPDTEFEGAVVVGAFVEVKLARGPDGSLLALEVEVEDEDEEKDDEHEDDGGGGASGSPGTPDPGSTESSGSGSGSGGSSGSEDRDDGGEQSEADDDDDDDGHGSEDDEEQEDRSSEDDDDDD